MNKVLCVVVTYNRIDCLKQCLGALRNQTFKGFDIVVVNNGSTDGTKEYLDGISDLVVINQGNLGSSGGQYSGEKYGYEKGYEWIWMMDDDGYPEEHQLEELLKYGRKGNMVLNAVVIDIENHSKLAFGSMSDVSKLDEITDKIFHPFNGTFIHRDIISKIGFVKKEMFIWGDEQEYLRRIIRAGYQPKTIKSAVHYHPCEKGKKLNVFPFFNKYYVLDKPKHLSKYYYRNMGYIDKTYGKHSYSCLINILLRVFALSWHFRFLEILKFLKYYWRGMNNNYK